MGSHSAFECDEGGLVFTVHVARLLVQHIVEAGNVKLCAMSLEFVHDALDQACAGVQLAPLSPGLNVELPLAELPSAPSLWSLGSSPSGADPGSDEVSSDPGGSPTLDPAPPAPVPPLWSKLDARSRLARYAGGRGRGSGCRGS